jgi:outer membrane protein
MLKHLFIAATLTCSLQYSQAQTGAAANNVTVVAYVDAESVISAMPEFKQVESDIESYKKILEKQLKADEQALQTFYQSTMQKAQAGQLSPRQQKEAEEKLQKMQQDLQKKAMEAEQQVIAKEGELTKPLYEKFNAALKAVAEANKYNYIVDKKVMLHAGGEDATLKLKTKLGLP